MSFGVGSRQGLDLKLLWLWGRPAAAALIQPFAWEPLYVMGVALKNKKQKQKKQQQKNQPLGVYIYFSFFKSKALIPLPLKQYFTKVSSITPFLTELVLYIILRYIQLKKRRYI